MIHSASGPAWVESRQVAEVYGLTQAHITQLHDCMAHTDIVDDLNVLREAASAAGFELGIASGFRDYQRQLTIWNSKASGQRPVLASDETPLDIATLSPAELVFSILRWSALPGASRHHWGTDFDVYDAGVVKQGYSLTLTYGETQPTGAFAEFYYWLDSYLTTDPCFFRPYQTDTGGVAPEPWHLSHRRCAEQIQKHFTLERLRQLTQQSDLKLKGAVLENLDEIYRRFISVPPG